MARSVRCLFLISLISVIFQVKSAGQSGTLRINEFLAINETVLTDEDGDYPDWIEIYNQGTVAVNLAGWTLTDSKSQPGKWVFPDISIKANAYLIVYASGKNRRIPGKALHTNFKLSGDGEYFALINPSGKPVTEFNPSYPVQKVDISFGYNGIEYVFLDIPTPGEANSAAAAGLIPAPVFSRNHGFFSEPFTLEITSVDSETEIWYTTNGSQPGKGWGIKYTGPITISTTSVIRAVSVKGMSDRSNPTTCTYIFPEDVIRQGNNPPGYPDLWGPYTGITGTAIADYGMDQDMMNDTVFARTVKNALLDIPTISIVTERGNLFSHSQDPDTGGIYIYTGPPLTSTTNGTGFGWERPASFEYFDPGDSVSIQVDCGLRIQGGHSRRPEKSPKHSFRLVFSSKYGPSKLNYPVFGDKANTSFDNLVLRAGFGNSWVHWTHSERAMAQYLRDRWTKDSQLAMGYNASHGIFVHLYLNGIYWGLYNPSERMDKDFASAYLGGNADDYDVIKDYAEVSDGNIDAWSMLIQLANAGLAGSEAYNIVRGTYSDGTPNPNFTPYVDVVNLADYMLLNFYGGNWDWDHHNWVAIRNRENPGKGFTFLCWDSEHVVETLNANILSENNNNCPSRVFQQLLKNEEFKRLFADRIQKHCFGNGVLTPASAAQRWEYRSEQVEEAVTAESARWGDYRRDVHPWQNGPFDLYTREAYWLPERSFMLDTYFPGRTDVFVSQLKNAGLFPTVDAPDFTLNGSLYDDNIINSGDTLRMSVSRGTIYYTNDGTDPVNWAASASVSATAVRYTGNIFLEHSSHIKARTIYNGQWSAVNDEYFLIPSEYEDLKITEVHYHPLGGGETENSCYEFIEMKNTGSGTLNLAGIEFTQGIRFTFPAESEIKPGGFVVLASQTESFLERYDFYPFGEYSGRLDNNGEEILFLSPARDTIGVFTYGSGNGWPASADGEGYSIVPVDYNPADDQDRPESWRASYYIGGSPGKDDIFVSGDILNRTSTSLVSVYQNYPNPFTEVTYIPYKLNEDATVEIIISNLNGKIVARLVDDFLTKGQYIAAWRGIGQGGAPVAGGIYICRLTARSNTGAAVITKKIVFIK